MNERAVPRLLLHADIYVNTYICIRKWGDSKYDSICIYFICRIYELEIMATGEFMGVVTIIVLFYQIWFFSFLQDGFPSRYFRRTYLANVSQRTLSFLLVKDIV